MIMPTVLMLIRREFWENRSLWIAPLVIAGIILVSAAFSATPFDATNMHPGWFRGPDPTTSRTSRTSTSASSIYAGVLSMLTVVQLFTLGIVVFFYLLDCLTGRAQGPQHPVLEVAAGIGRPGGDVQGADQPRGGAAVCAGGQCGDADPVRPVIWARFHDSVFGAMIVPWPVGCVGAGAGRVPGARAGGDPLVPADRGLPAAGVGLGAQERLPVGRAAAGRPCSWSKSSSRIRTTSPISSAGASWACS